MFYQTRCQSNLFVIDRTIVSLFNVERRRIPNFRYHGNKGQSRANLNDTIRLPALENHVWRNILDYIAL